MTKDKVIAAKIEQESSNFRYDLIFVAVVGGTALIAVKTGAAVLSDGDALKYPGNDPNTPQANYRNLEEAEHLRKVKEAGTISILQNHYTRILIIRHQQVPTGIMFLIDMDQNIGGIRMELCN